MSELWLSSTTKKSRKFSSLLLSDLFLFCSLILSHPLYFSYFIFFSPYLLKLLSFLSPLFITTSLLLLALFTFSPGLLIHDRIPPQFSESKVGFILSTYNALVEKLQPKTVDENENEDFHQFEELEVYRIVFDTSIFDLSDNPFEDFHIKSEESCFESFEAPPVPAPECLIQDKAVGPIEKEIVWPAMEEKIVEGFLKEFDEFENVTCIVEEKKIVPLGANPDKVEEQKEVSLVRVESEAMGNKVIYDAVKIITYNGGDYTSKVVTNSLNLGDASINSTDIGGEYTSDVMDSSRTLGSNLGSYGSMRREKEWKRTLACKLFEERHNVEGSEGMDSLWETYELDSSKIKKKGDAAAKKKIKKKKSEIGYYDAEEEQEGEEEYNDGQLCCLQALKFSSGKMNLGIGKPNLVKISKAIKGIGWLHHLTKHGKKGYN